MNEETSLQESDEQLAVLEEVLEEEEDQEGFDWTDDDEQDYDDSMDGDHESALASAGYGVDESYGNYCDDGEDFNDFGCFD